MLTLDERYDDGVNAWIEFRLTDDPWRGRQARYEQLVKVAPGRLGLTTKLPSGKPITVPLGQLPRPRYSSPGIESRMAMMTPSDDTDLALVHAIRHGDLDRLERLLDGNEAAAAWIGDRKGAARSLLHVATDWPGYFRTASRSCGCSSQPGPIPTRPPRMVVLARRRFTGRRAATMSMSPTR